MNNEHNNLYDVELVPDNRLKSQFKTSTKLLDNFVGNRGEVISVDKEGRAILRADDLTLVDDLKKQDFVDNLPFPGHHPSVFPHGTVTTKEPLCSPGLTD